MKELIRKRKSLQSDSLRKLENIQNRSELKQQTSKINALVQAEDHEIAITLQRVQQEFIESCLNQTFLLNASLPGIGAKLKNRLIQGGLQTAAHITYWRATSISGIGASKANVLMKWRAEVEAAATRTAPSSLPAHWLAAIRSKYQNQRVSLEALHRQQIEQTQVLVEAAKAEFQTKKRILDKEEQEAQLQVKKTIADLKTRYERSLAAIQKSSQEVEEEFKTNLGRVDELIARAHKELFGISRQVGAAEREIQAFSNIRLLVYIKYVCFFWTRIA
jgi:DNA-binding helix-hairpin-helix protein with protein kinase domain